MVQPQVCYYQFPSSVVTVFGSKYIHAASLACILIGISSLFFASLDKYIIIRHPFFYGGKITKKITHVVVVCIWLVCIAIGVVRFHGIVLVKDGYLALIATSFVLTIIVQIMIFVTAREQNKRIQQLHRSLEHNHPRGDEEENAVEPRASQSSNKAAKTIGLILVFYIASWLPVNLYRQEYRWNGGDPKVYHKWVKIINLMIQLHSCINPWVFVLRSKDMKFGIASFMAGFGVHRCFRGERSLDTCNNGNNVTLSSRVLNSSNANISENRDDTRNAEESCGQRNGEIHNAGESENIKGRVNTSYRNSCENISDSDKKNGSSQSGNIQGEDVSNRDNENVTVKVVERKRDEQNNVSDNNLSLTDAKVEEERIINDGNIQNEENRESTHGERSKGNDINISDTGNNNSRDEGLINSENDGNTPYG